MGVSFSGCSLCWLLRSGAGGSALIFPAVSRPAFLLKTHPVPLFNQPFSPVPRGTKHWVEWSVFFFPFFSPGIYRSSVFIGEHFAQRPPKYIFSCAAEKRRGSAGGGSVEGGGARNRERLVVWWRTAFALTCSAFRVWRMLASWGLPSSFLPFFLPSFSLPAVCEHASV